MACSIIDSVSMMYCCCWNEYMTAPQWQEHLLNTMQTLRKNLTAETEGQSKVSDPTVIKFFSQAAGGSGPSTLSRSSMRGLILTPGSHTQFKLSLFPCCPVTSGTNWPVIWRPVPSPTPPPPLCKAP